MIELVNPFPVHSLPRVWRWVEAHRDKIADDYFAKDAETFIAQWITLQQDGRLSWGVVRGGILGGVITSQRIRPTVADFHCLFSSDFWGRDTVVPALQQVCGILFEDESVDKLSTIAFAKNNSLAGMIRHFGVTREGLLRGHTRQDGKLVDLQVLGLQRERFNELGSKRTTQQFVVGPERVDKQPVQPEHDEQQHHRQHRDDVANRTDVRSERGQHSKNPHAVPRANPADVVQAHSAVGYRP